MKLTFDIDATPQELRAFFGWPDVEPLQQEMLKSIQRNLAAGAEGFDPMTLMRPWLPPHLQAMEALQKGFWQAYQQAASHKNPTPSDAETAE